MTRALSFRNLTRVDSAQFALALIFSLFGFQQVFAEGSFRDPQEVYLKLEKGDPYISVFSKPGVNWKYCTKNAKGECKEGMGWLDKESRVWVVGPKIKAITPDPFTNEMVEEEYYPVQFEYQREGIDENGKKELKTHIKGPIGYIDAAYVDFERRQPLYSEPKSSKKGALTCKLTSLSDKKKIEDIKCALELKNIRDTADLLKDRVGFCADLKSDKDKKHNLYDSTILKKLKSMDVPKIKGENGQYMTQEQLVDIDALARTLYGEMASCYKHGLHYPMAVARIAVNRAEDERPKRGFIDNSHFADKPQLSKVVTTPGQFSIWLRKLNGAENPPLGMAMCPPREASQKMWSGRKPSKQELAIWEHTMQIATEAVLFPNSFKKRTQNLDNRFFYTSGMGKFGKMVRDNVKIEGRPLDKGRCIEVWHDKKS